MSLRRAGGLVVLLAAAALARPARGGDAPKESPRTLRYEIDASLDAALHEVTATGRLTWRNDASRPAGEMRLHLYLNAFRDEKSTFLREAKSHRGSEYDASRPGSIELLSFREKAGEDEGEERVAKAKFVAPDDANPDDRTVLAVPLEHAVAPGESRTFLLSWKTKLPKVFARAGYAGDFHMVAQWYPKPGVFADAPAGGDPCWNCHQYHGTSEFFSDYGVYVVRLTVPSAYAGKVGATGTLASEAKADGRVTYEYHAEDVHDFAWVCDTDFVERAYDFPGGDGIAPKGERERIAEMLGRPPDDLLLSPVKVRILLQAQHADQAERWRSAVSAALTWMGFWFGPYPYSHLTVVDPDPRGEDAGGMEYPTLFTGWADWIPADRDWEPEFTLVHEFGHQHFYGLLATNEFEDAWMDEGVNTWATERVMRRAYPPRPPIERFAGIPLYRERPVDFGGWLPAASTGTAKLTELLGEEVRLPWGTVPPIGAAARALGLSPPDDVPLWPDLEEVRPLSFLREVPPLTHLRLRPTEVREDERGWVANRTASDPIAGTPAWRHLDDRSYYANSYGRTAAALRTLEGIVGERAVLRGMRTYAERFRFRHPKPEDLFAALDEAVRADGQDPIDWFFDEVFRRPARVDYAIGSIDVDEGEEGKPTESRVVVRRLGETRLPVDVLVRFEDGTQRTYTWRRDGSIDSPPGGTDGPEAAASGTSGQATWMRLVLKTMSPVVAAEVDPERKMWMDADRTNDGRRAEPDHRASARLGVRLLGWAELNSAWYAGM